jgi:hypothetical protein
MLKDVTYKDYEINIRFSDNLSAVVCEPKSHRLVKHFFTASEKDGEDILLRLVHQWIDEQ